MLLLLSGLLCLVASQSLLSAEESNPKAGLIVKVKDLSANVLDKTVVAGSKVLRIIKREKKVIISIIVGLILTRVVIEYDESRMIDRLLKCKNVNHSQVTQGDIRYFMRMYLDHSKGWVFFNNKNRVCAMKGYLKTA